MKNKRTALIVDDEEIIVEIEEFMFQKIGFEILIAKDSAQACQLYQDEKDNIDSRVGLAVHNGVRLGQYRQTAAEGRAASAGCVDQGTGQTGRGDEDAGEQEVDRPRARPEDGEDSRRCVHHGLADDGRLPQSRRSAA